MVVIVWKEIAPLFSKQYLLIKPNHKRRMDRQTLLLKTEFWSILAPLHIIEINARVQRKIHAYIWYHTTECEKDTSVGVMSIFSIDNKCVLKSQAQRISNPYQVKGLINDEIEWLNCSACVNTNVHIQIIDLS